MTLDFGQGLCNRIIEDGIQNKELQKYISEKPEKGKRSGQCKYRKFSDDNRVELLRDISCNEVFTSYEIYEKGTGKIWRPARQHISDTQMSLKCQIALIS